MLALLLIVALFSLLSTTGDAISVAAATTVNHNTKRSSRNDHTIVKIGPVCLQKKSQAPSFCWQANVNRSTGLATSQEVSTIKDEKFTSTLRAKMVHTNIQQYAEKLFPMYVPWLCSGKITLGLFKAAPSTQQNEKGGMEIQDRFFGLCVLRFGAPKKLSYTARSKNKDNRQSTIDQCYTSWSFPVMGGFLAAKKGGKLVFRLCRTTTKTRIQGPSVTYQDKTYLVWQQQQQDRLVMETELVDYQPTIVGLSCPSNSLRTRAYLGSQSLIHAFVMWRFHGHCRACIIDKAGK